MRRQGPNCAAIDEVKSFDLLNCPVRFLKTGKKIVIGSIAPIRDRSGRVSGAVIAFHDVTSQQTLETEYQRVRHLESLQRLAGGIAHNLTGVVSIVSGYAEALLQSMEECGDRSFGSVRFSEAGRGHIWFESDPGRRHDVHAVLAGQFQGTAPGDANAVLECPE